MNNSKEVVLGLGLKKFYFIFVVLLIVFATGGLICSLVIDKTFIACTYSTLPVILFLLHLSFVSIRGDKIVVHRFFRPPLVFPVQDYERVTHTLISIPGSNTITIFFRNGRSFQFLGGGFRLGQIASKLQLVKSELNSDGN